MAHLQISELIPAPAVAVFDYLCDPKHLPTLLAPHVEVQVLTPEVALKRGHEVHFMMTRLGMSQSVRFRIEDVLRGSRLSYRQTEGIFANWTHTMKFVSNDEQLSLVTDIVDYGLPLGLIGALADDLLVKSDMRKILADRLLRAREHFEALKANRPESVSAPETEAFLVD